LSSYDPNPDLTTALGDWMTNVPATTDMRYRIGGIAETFMSTLLLMLVEQGRIRSLAEMCRTKTEKCLF
jgi:hypothetical protein